MVLFYSWYHLDSLRCRSYPILPCHENPNKAYQMDWSISCDWISMRGHFHVWLGKPPLENLFENVNKVFVSQNSHFKSRTQNNTSNFTIISKRKRTHLFQCGEEIQEVSNDLCWNLIDEGWSVYWTRFSLHFVKFTIKFDPRITIPWTDFWKVLVLLIEWSKVYISDQCTTVQS